MRPRLGDGWTTLHALLMRHEDAVLAVASGRYEWIGRMVRGSHAAAAGAGVLTSRIDRLATHPVVGLVILAAVLGLTFWLTYAIGTPLQAFLDTHLVQAGAAWRACALAMAHRVGSAAS